MTGQKEKTFPVIEVFGPTIQGEGALAGAVSHFVRFGGCDFACTWCDSAHAVLAQNIRRLSRKLTAEQILHEIGSLRVLSADWVTLSGGNPALLELGNLVHLLHENGYKVAVETQGSRWQNWLATVDQLTVSPKPPSSGMTNEYFHTFMVERDIHVRSDLRDATCLKTPVYDEEDLDWALGVHHWYPYIPFYLSIVTEMGGLYGNFGGGRVDTSDTLLARYQRIVDQVLQRQEPDVRVIPQLHYLLWGNRTGV